MLACILIFTGLATTGSSGSDCSDNSYALSHPEVCGAAIEGCEDNNYALNHPLECAKPAAGCNDNNYALTHPSECGKKVGCEDNDYALSHPLECGKQVPQVCTPGSRRWGSLPETLSPSLCRSDWTAIADCNQYGQWVFIDCVSPSEDTCTPSMSCSVLGCGKSDSCDNFCGSCPAPAVVDNLPTATINVPSSAAPTSQLSLAVIGTDDKDVAQLLLYDGSSNLLETFDCTGIQTSCSKTFTRTAPAAPSTFYTFKARSKDNAGQVSSAFASGTGTTTAALAVPPVVPPAVPPATPPVVRPLAPELALPKPLQVVAIKFPLQPLFLRALNFPDSDCVRPGESALLAVKVQNTAKTALKDVKFAAAIPELGIRTSDGPVTLKANGKLTRLLRLNIPEDAEKGTYYLRFSISNNKFSRAVHRTFVVESSC